MTLGLTLEPRGGKLAVTPGDRCPAELADSLLAPSTDASQNGR
jgi:hypothetical protein